MTIKELLEKHKILKRTTLGRITRIDNFAARLYHSPGYRMRESDRAAVAAALTELGEQLIADAKRLTADPEPVKV